MSGEQRYVKVREAGQKRFAFISRRGTNHLRVHATIFKTPEAAQKFIDDNSPQNPSIEWRIAK